MRKGQGSLEYLIIVAAVLAVAAIVIMFVTGALGGSREAGNINQCRASAAALYNEVELFGSGSGNVDNLIAECEQACEPSNNEAVCTSTITQSDINDLSG